MSFFGTPGVPLTVSAASGSRQSGAGCVADGSGWHESGGYSEAPEAKDYLDLDALILQGAVDLLKALAAGRAIFGPMFKSELTLKALCFYGDGNLETVPMEVRSRLTAAAMAVDLGRLPQIPSHERLQ